MNESLVGVERTNTLQVKQMYIMLVSTRIINDVFKFLHE